MTQKLELKNKYDISFCLSNVVHAHNIDEVTKLILENITKKFKSFN